MELPLGLIALYWIRMYKPLLERGLPQSSSGRMAFATPAFEALRGVAPFDLRPGASFGAEMAVALRQALRDAARNIAQMPALHLSFANNVPVFPTRLATGSRWAGAQVIDLELLWSYGSTRVPLGIWQALRRMAAWIEPMLVAEWVRMTQGYGERSGRLASADEVHAALRWLEPARDTGFVRDLALRRFSQGLQTACVWSGKALRPDRIDIDHCLPWSAWPCGDLWNLLPAAPEVNRNSKRERIVGAAALADARPRIIDWWQSAYLEGGEAVRHRFAEEARSSLPLALDRAPELDELFGALDFRRLRLRQETQVPEWSGVRAGA